MTTKRKIQAGIALTAITSFLIMPVNLACANTITAGNSGIGSMTNITNSGDTTTITSGYVNANGTGLNHFNDFTVTTGGTANLVGADRYINMVDKQVNINGVLNAFTKGNLPANAMFVAPNGFVVGAGGVLNVGGLQVVVPAQTDYNALIRKAGESLEGGSIPYATPTLTEADFATLKANGAKPIEINGQVLSNGDVDIKTGAYVDIAGKIVSTGNVVIQAGTDIYFTDNGLIDTTGTLNGITGIGDISLFANTGDIVASGNLNINSSGDVTLSAVQGGVGSVVDPNPPVIGEKKTTGPIQIKVAEGKKLNVDVATEITDDSTNVGLAAINNNTTNLNIGSLKGGNVKITNKGFGTISTTEKIDGVSQLYINAENGMLNIAHEIEAPESIALSGKVGVDISENLNVSGAGYISVYSADGAVSMKDATLKSGNIDITAKGGDVEIGNITVEGRGPAESVLRLLDNRKLQTGISAPKVFRDDGVHINSTNDNIIQAAGTKITSAGVVEFTAGQSINSTVKADDMILVSGGKVVLDTEGTTRLGKITASTLTVTGDTFLVDDKVQANTIDIQAKDTLTVRPKTYLDKTHRTYGSIEGKNSVNINAKNGIFATEQRQSDEGAMITSPKGVVKLTTDGDIKALGADSPYITVDAEDQLIANANNVNVYLSNEKGNIGSVIAKNDVNIGAVGDVNLLNLLGSPETVQAGNDLTISAAGNIKQETTYSQAGAIVAPLVAKNDMNLTSANGNVGMPERFLDVTVDGVLSASAAKGGVYINGAKNESLDVASVTAGKDIIIKAPKFANVISATAGKDMTVTAAEDVVIASANVKGEVNATAGNDIRIGAPVDLTLGKIDAGNDVVIEGKKNVLQGSKTPAIKAGNDLKISSEGADVGAADKYLTVDVTGMLDASAKGNVYIAGVDDLNATVNAGGSASLKTPGYLTLSSATTGKDLKLESGADIAALNTKVGGELDAIAANDINVKAIGNLTLGNVNAGNNATISGPAYIYQGSGKPAVTTGKNLKISTTGTDIGAANKYLTVNVGGELDADAPGSIYIYGYGDLDVNKVNAGQNVGLKAENNLHQVATYDPENPSIIAGGNMTLGSDKANVGDPSNPLSIVVPGQLDAKAPNGGVYIGSKENITIGQVSAAKNVSIESDGFIHQTDKGARPAIIAGEKLHLLSKTNNVGDPNNYLTVQVGDGLDAAAPNGGVYIYGYGDLRTDKVIAGEDIVIGGNKNIIIPHDSEEGNIIAGGNVRIEAGDSILNGGGSGVGIKHGGDLDLIANLNQKDPAGSIGTLPYNDLTTSINVISGGKVTAEEVGVDPANQVLNVNILNRPNTNTDDDSAFDVDDRDQRTLNVNNNNNGRDGANGGVNHHRQDVRYNVVSNEYVLLSSKSDSGAKVQNILNISKNGMLVKTDELPKVGENVKIQMDYKGLPFTIEGKIVRTDAARKTAGIQFNNLDKLTSSMLLYLGMRTNK